MFNEHLTFLYSAKTIVILMRRLIDKFTREKHAHSMETRVQVFPTKYEKESWEDGSVD